MNKCSLINLSKLPTCVHIRELNALVCPDVMCFTEKCLVDRNKKMLELFFFLYLFNTETLNLKPVFTFIGKISKSISLAL